MTHNGKDILTSAVIDLRDIWEETSFQLEKFQTNPECVKQEAGTLRYRTVPPYKLAFDMCESHCMGDFPQISKCIILRDN